MFGVAKPALQRQRLYLETGRKSEKNDERERRQETRTDNRAAERFHSSCGEPHASARADAQDARCARKAGITFTITHDSLANRRGKQTLTGAEVEHVACTAAVGVDRVAAGVHMAGQARAESRMVNQIRLVSTRVSTIHDAAGSARRARSPSRSRGALP